MMKEKEVRRIKTVETSHDIRLLDRSAEMAKNLGRAAIRTRDQVEKLFDDGRITPEEYAEDAFQNAAGDAAAAAGKRLVKPLGEDHVKNRIDYLKAPQKKAREMQFEHAEKKVQSTDQNIRDPAFPNLQPPAEERRKDIAPEETVFRKSAWYERQPISPALKSKPTGKVNPSESAVKGRPKTREERIKVPLKDVKTAQQTMPDRIKTNPVAVRKTAKQPAVSAKASSEFVKKAAASAQRAAIAVERAFSFAVRSIISTAKALIVVLASGGWLALVMIVIICLTGLLTGSAYGIFFSSEDTGSDKTMQKVVREINQEYTDQIEAIKAGYSYDEIEMSGSTAVWREVLAVYAVKTNGDPDNPQEVASLDDDKILLLKEIFWDMNRVYSRTKTQTVTVIVETDDGYGNIVEEEAEETVTVLYITVSHKTAEEMAERYGFTDEQRQQLAALLDKDNQPLWSAVLYGFHSGDGAIVAVALSQIGNYGGQPYWSWYGFGSRVEWCACFVSWCANECGYIEDGIIPRFAGCINGVQWFKDRGQWMNGGEEPMPGMIIFFDWDMDGKSDHTGIVERVEDGVVYTVEGNADDCCKERQYGVGYYRIMGYGVPAY